MTDPMRHEPVRPSWLCRACGFTYPCRPAERELLDRFRQPKALFAHMAALLADACHDLDHAPAGELWDRFIGWVPVRKSPTGGTT